MDSGTGQHPAPRGGFSGKDFFECIRLGMFTGILLAIPVALGFKLDYGPTALIIGVGAFLLWFVVLLLRGLDPDGRSAGLAALRMILGGVLTLGLIVGVVAFIVLKIDLEARKSAPPPDYGPPPRATFSRRLIAEASAFNRRAGRQTWSCTPGSGLPCRRGRPCSEGGACIFGWGSACNMFPVRAAAAGDRGCRPARRARGSSRPGPGP